ncbi:MAG: hypothetical protein AABW87_02255 [Nanoarchaeota archaeon]
MPVTRKPYAEKFIRDLKNEDFKVALSGTIINKTENDFFLDDGTGQIRCIYANVSEYEYVRIFGTLMPLPDGFELQGEIIQDLSKIDKQLHKRLKEALSRQK